MRTQEAPVVAQPTPTQTRRNWCRLVLLLPDPRTYTSLGVDIKTGWYSNRHPNGPYFSVQTNISCRPRPVNAHHRYRPCEPRKRHWRRSRRRRRRGGTGAGWRYRRPRSQNLYHYGRRYKDRLVLKSAPERSLHFRPEEYIMPPPTRQRPPSIPPQRSQEAPMAAHSTKTQTCRSQLAVPAPPTPPASRRGSGPDG